MSCPSAPDVVTAQLEREDASLKRHLAEQDDLLFRLGQCLAGIQAPCFNLLEALSHEIADLRLRAMVLTHGQ